jgi:hypothetical protein
MTGAGLKIGESTRVRVRARLRWRTTIALCLCAAFLAATPVSADRYNSAKAAHPIRIAAYILHPIGYAIETLVARPAHWLASKRPLKNIFGHKD